MHRTITGFPTYANIIITDSLLVGGQFNPGKIYRLAAWGVTGIVNMRTHSYLNRIQKSSIDYLHLPTKDRHAPTLEHLQQGITFITKHLSQSGKVYIHCRFGEGRGPTMAAAYLISNGMTVADAITTVTCTRPYIRITKPQRLRLEELRQLLHPSD